MLLEQIKELKSKLYCAETDLNELKEEGVNEWISQYNPLLTPEQLDLICNLIQPSELSKLRNSITIGFSSINNRLDSFGSSGLTYSRNFYYNPLKYKFVKNLLQVQKTYLNDLAIIILHFDNNDVQSPYGDKLYHTSTTYVAFEPNMEGIDAVELVSGNKKIPSTIPTSQIIDVLIDFTKDEDLSKKGKY